MFLKGTYPAFSRCRFQRFILHSFYGLRSYGDAAAAQAIFRFGRTGICCGNFKEFDLVASDRSCVFVFRSARLRQNVYGAHPRKSAQLRKRADACSLRHLRALYGNHERRESRRYRNRRRVEYERQRRTPNQRRSDVPAEFVAL